MHEYPPETLAEHGGLRRRKGCGSGDGRRGEGRESREWRGVEGGTPRGIGIGDRSIRVVPLPGLVLRVGLAHDVETSASPDEPAGTAKFPDRTPHLHRGNPRRGTYAMDRFDTRTFLCQGGRRMQWVDSAHGMCRRTQNFSRKKIDSTPAECVQFSPVQMSPMHGS